MTVLLISFLAFAATMLGGVFALRFRDNLHLILGFSAGAVVAVALFDLLPEAMRLTGDASRLAMFVAAGFFAYLVLDRVVLLHPQHAEDDAHRDHGPEHERGHEHGHEHGHTHAPGAFGAITLVAHSFLDGVAIGAGFQASPAVGALVAAAIITHDFSDGINTVGFILKGGPEGREGWKRALPWLLLDALAPVVGAACTLFVRVPQIGPVLAVFAGCFLYLGASDLIPESQHAHPRAATTAMTLLGAGVLYAAVRLWGG
ncbi:MAG TPA: ZIP family metal transporter [Rhizomicrobium sp.]|jgi:ZIP family zinc transporter